MEIRPNKLRELLRAGKPTMGTRIESTWPHIAEVAASSGALDYVEFEGEYAPYDQKDLENICRAVELYGCSTVVKVDRQNCDFMAQKAIAAGAHGVMLADVYTAEDVRDFVYKLTPSSPNGGIFGRPNRRLGMNGTGRMSMADYVKMVNDVVIMIMVEKEETMKNLEEICQVPGLDMIAFGPFDYAMNVGWEAGPDWDKLNEVHKEMIRICQKYNVPVCCQLNSTDEVEMYYNMGVRHFNIGDEVSNHINYFSRTCMDVRKFINK